MDATNLRDRQQEYVKLGHDLDAYAVKHKRELGSAKKAALVPSPGRELYATTLACMAKIDQYRAISKLALDMFPFNAFVGSIKAMEAERTGVARPPGEREAFDTEHDVQATGAPWDEPGGAPSVPT